MGGDHAPNREPEQLETVVIGGGQAGLSVGYHLARRGRPFVILDANRAGRRRLAQPLGLAAPVHPGPVRRAGGDAVPRSGPLVPDQGPGGRLPGGLRDPVRAPGSDRRPRGPALEERRPVRGRRGRPALGGRQRGGRHVDLPGPPGAPLRRRARSRRSSSSIPAGYRNPSQLREGGVLVVGAGNSGAEIALEVASRHPTWLAGKDSGHVPFRIEGAAARYVFQPLLFRVVGHRVLTVDTPIGRKLRPRLISHAAPAGPGQAQGSHRRRDPARPQGRRGARRPPPAGGPTDPRGGQRHLVHRVRSRLLLDRPPRLRRE